MSTIPPAGLAESRLKTGARCADRLNIGMFFLQLFASLTPTTRACVEAAASMLMACALMAVAGWMLGLHTTALIAAPLILAATVLYAGAAGLIASAAQEVWPVALQAARTRRDKL